MNQLVIDKKSELIALCQEYKVKSMYVFGSVCTDKFTDQSDIDFLIAFDNVSLDDYADYYFDLLYKLQNLLGREIDLVTESSLSNPYFIQSLDKTKELLYAA